MWRSHGHLFVLGCLYDSLRWVRGEHIAPALFCRIWWVRCSNVGMGGGVWHRVHFVCEMGYNRSIASAGFIVIHGQRRFLGVDYEYRG